MFAHLFASERFHTAIQVFGEVGEKITTFRQGVALRLGLGPSWVSSRGFG